jgi:hypothetical protein
MLHLFLAPFHFRRECFRATPGVLQFVTALVTMSGELE